MSFDRKAKSVIVSFLDNLEVWIVNLAMIAYQNFTLFKYAAKTDFLTKEYKKEIKKYWSKYKRISPKWHKYYSSKNGIFDPRYIPNDLYYTKIDQYFNNRKLGWGVNDKNYYSLILSDIRQPDTVVRKINGILYDTNYSFITLDEALDLISQHNELICKPSLETGSGKGIIFWEREEGLQTIKKYLEDKLVNNCILQKVIKQHRDLSAIHENSVNTIRIVSLILKNEIHILSSCLRMGVGNSRIDNVTAGGISCGINIDGTLKKEAFSYYEGYRYYKHPQGFVFDGFKVPSYKKAVEMVINAHRILAHFRLISWDIAILEDGEPVLIEANMRQGGINLHQFCNGPLFGELTDAVLEEVFFTRKN